MNQRMKQQLLAVIGEEANIDGEIDQTLYPKPDWAVNQIVRGSGLVEDICCHGIGHPNRDWLEIHDPDGERGFGIHCCDFCCMGDDGKHLKKFIEISQREQKMEKNSTEPFQELWDPEIRKKIREQYGDE